MKKRYLIIVSQLFQLMVAAQLKETVLKAGDVDIVIMPGNSAGLNDVYEKIKDTVFFENVYLIDSNILGKKKEKFKTIISFLRGKYNWKIINENLHDVTYDKIISVTYSLYFYLLCAYFGEIANVEIYMYDEGFGVYLGYNIYEICNLHTICYKLMDAVIAFKKRPRVLDKFKGYYLFYPKLLQFKTRYGSYQIPKIDRNDIEYYNFIQTAFGDTTKSDLDAKYIFFEENIINSSIDDFSLIMKIAEKVGKENIVVKLHPRRNIDRFSDKGIKVSKSTGIPWEAFLLTNDFRDKVILTISSSSVFSPRLYFDMNIPTIMLYKIVGPNPGIVNVKKYIKYVEDFKKRFGNNGFFVPNSMSELMKLL